MSAKEMIQSHVRKNDILNEETFLRQVLQAARELLEELAQKSRKNERWQIVQTNTEGTIIGFHKSQADCARALNVTRQAVNQAIGRQTVVDGQYRLSRVYVAPA